MKGFTNETLKDAQTERKGLDWVLYVYYNGRKQREGGRSMNEKERLGWTRRPRSFC